MKPDISVIVPMYKVEKYVTNCLSKLQKQTFKNFEVLAINDGSPDNSVEIAKEFEKKDKRIRVISKPNSGYGSVLEYAIKLIDSDYFIICDPDDWLREDCLEVLYKLAQKNNLDVTVADRYDVYSDNSEAISRNVKPSSLKQIKPEQVYTTRKEIQEFSFFEVSPHAKLYKTSLLKEVNFPQHVSYTDFLLYILALSKTKRIMYYDKPLAYYLRDRPGNTATDVRKSIINDYLVVWLSTLNQIKDTHNNILMYRLYVQLRLILSEYGRVNEIKFKDKYWLELLKAIRTIQIEKNNMSIPDFENTFLKQIFFKGMMNPLLYKSFSKLYVKAK